MYIRGNNTKNDSIADYIKKEIIKNVAKGNLSQHNSGIVEEYLDYMRSTRGCREKTLKSAYHGLHASFGIIEKDYQNYDIRDIRKIFSEIRSSGRASGTQRTYITILKQFFKYLIKEEIISNLQVEKITEITLPKVACSITEDKLPTHEEIIKIIQSCRTSRNRAMIGVLTEGGLRINELLNLKWRNVIFQPNFIELVIEAEIEKTCRSRIVQIISNQHYLNAWRTDSTQTNQDDYIFYPRNGVQFTYTGWQNLLHRLLKYAGINKKIHAHLFRHYAVTQDMKNPHLPDSIVASKFWGAGKSSVMPSRYTHLGKNDQRDQYLKANGIITEEINTQAEPVQCPRCGYISPSEINFCPRYSMALNEKAIGDLQTLRQIIHEQPQYQELVHHAEFMVEQAAKA